MPIAMSETACPDIGGGHVAADPADRRADQQRRQADRDVPGSFTSVKKPIRMIASTGRPIQAPPTSARRAASR